MDGRDAGPFRPSGLEVVADGLVTDADLLVLEPSASGQDLVVNSYTFGLRLA
jgi:hypothetical protein